MERDPHPPLLDGYQNKGLAKFDGNKFFRMRRNEESPAPQTHSEQRNGASLRVISHPRGDLTSVASKGLTGSSFWICGKYRGYG